MERTFFNNKHGKSDDLFIQAKVIMDLLLKIFEQLLLSSEIQKIINDKSLKFDLLVLESFVRPALVFSHIFKAPVISINSFGAMFGWLKMMGASSHPLLFPSPVRQKLCNLTLWDKITELYNHYLLEKVFCDSDNYATERLRKYFGVSTPSIHELSKNVDMLFLNVHPIWENNRSVPPSVLYIGGIHNNSEKELPKDLNSYLESSKKGVIYISFGTNVMPSLLPPEKIKILVKVCSQLPYNILWKWDKDKLPGQTENIKVEKWLPQSDLLSGLQSTNEAINAGVPLIGIPFLGDQWYNVEHYVLFNIGLRIDMETLTEEKLKNSINTVIDDKSYRENILNLRSLMNDQPQRPLERAVWWTEHVLRHGGAKHLRSPAANMSWTEYFELEIITVLLLGLIFGILFMCFIMYFLWSFCQSVTTTAKFKQL